MTAATQLPRSAPEAQGVCSKAILAFLDAAKGRIDSFHSLMVLRHGHVVAEGWWHPYRAPYPHVLFSLSKSFTSTAVGLAVAEGRLSVEDRVTSFFPDDLPAQIGENLAAMRVRHLLTMSTGHDPDPTNPIRSTGNDHWVQGFLSRPPEYPPGSRFVYNSAATYMLSAIVQRLTGLTLLDYLRPRLFGPLGIESPTWETCPRGINTGGWGLSITTEDIARFGQLYLKKGLWHGKQLVPAAWIEQASRAQIANSGTVDWSQGYGYQFWRCQHNAYRGDGAFGQYCIIMPDQDAVIAITSGVGDMQAPLDLVWEHLLPAMKHDVLPADDTATRALHDRLAGLTIEPVAGEGWGPVPAKLRSATYCLEPNQRKIESIAFEPGSSQSTMIVRDEKGTHRLVCGHGAWVEGVTSFDRPSAEPVAGSCAWMSEDTWVARLCFCHTPFCLTLKCRFTGSELAMDVRANVSFGPLDEPQIKGVEQASSAQASGGR